MAFSAFRAPHVSTIALATAAVGGVAAAAAFILLRHRATSRNNFVPVGRVANIFIYPIKAVAGIEVPYADCIVTGPVYEGLKDRFMLIVKGDNFISMREEPRLGLIKMNFDNGKLTLTADGHPPLIIDACDPDELSKPSFTVSWSAMMNQHFTSCQKLHLMYCCRSSLQAAILNGKIFDLLSLLMNVKLMQRTTGGA